MSHNFLNPAHPAQRAARAGRSADRRAALASAVRGELRGAVWGTAALLGLGAILALTVGAETARAVLTGLPA